MQTITVASSKGGIGKTTVALGIAKALKNKDKTVLCADLDFSNPCLDILTDTDALYTLNDAAADRCHVTDAVKKTDSGIYILPSSQRGSTAEPIDVDKTAQAIKRAAEFVKADYVILDTGAGISEGFDVSCKIADRAVVVATHSPVSLRSAEMTALRLNEAGIEDVGLVVNSFDAEGVLDYGQHMGVVDIIDAAHIKLLGVVMFDYDLVLEAERDKKAEVKKISSQAFDNIAERIMGAEVPLFTGMKKLRRKRKKLF